MSSFQNLPFDRGEYDDASRLGDLAGHSYVVDDRDPSDKTLRRTEHQVHLRLVKNSSGFAILPKRLVTFKAGTNRTEVDGYSTTTAKRGVAVADEFLPAAGVPDGAYFFVVTHGPSLVLTDLAGGANNLLPEDTVLVALTAATSGATTAGRVAPQDITGATATGNAQLQGAFAQGMSAKTTANTNADLLAFVSSRWA